MDNSRGKTYLIFWCPPDSTPEFETSYLEDYGKVFATEVRIQGFEYVGRGVSATEEGSKNNAAIHYLMHLIRDGLLEKAAVAKRVPCLPLGIHPDGTFDPSPLPDFLEPVTDKSFNKDTISPRKDSCDQSVSHHSLSNQDVTSNFPAAQQLQGFNIQNRDPRKHGRIQEYVPLQVLVPRQAVANVIGTDGSVIKHIETNNGVKITFPEKSTDDDLEGRIFTLLGESDKVQAAAFTINKIIQLSLIKAANSLMSSGNQNVMLAMDTVKTESSVINDSTTTLNSRNVESKQQEVGNLSATYQQTEGLVAAVAPKEILSVKISIPQKLVGLAIGTGGVNIKRVEEETGVKIQFDQKMDDNGCKACEIFGTSDNVVTAVKKINAVINGDGLNNGNPPSTSQQTQGSATAPKPVSLRKMSVPQKLVGLVIGQGGANIKRIKESTGAKIQFDQTTDDKGCKTCEISGTPESVEAAVKEINSIIGLVVEDTDETATISQEDKKSVEKIGNQQTQRLVTAIAPKEILSMKIFIPQELVGLAVGVGGINVKRVEEEIGVKIYFDQKVDDKGCKMCEIFGTSEKVAAAVKEINLLIRGDGLSNGNLPSTSQQIQGSATTPKPVSLRKISVPREFVGMVIGQGGASIRRITEGTGAKIQFEQTTDDLGCKTCEISGTPESIEAAVKEINSIVGLVGEDTDETATVLHEDKKSVEIPIPEEVFDFVTGRNNVTISHIATKAGVKIFIPRKKIIDKAGISKCVILGKSDGVASAARRINALINIGVHNSKCSSSAAESVQTSQATQSKTVPQLIKASSKLEVTEMIPSSSQRPFAPSSSIIGQPPQLESKASVPQENVDRMSMIDGLQQKLLKASKASVPQENVGRMSMIDELQQKLLKKNKNTQSTSHRNNTLGIGDFLLKTRQKNKTSLPKPQRNWYRMAVGNSQIQSSEGYEFVMEPSLEREIDNALAGMRIIPKAIDKNSTFSFKPKLNISPGRTVTSQPDIVMRWWSPPQKNWDPWLNKNIDEPPLSEMSLEQISSHLMTAHFSQIQSDEKLQNNMKERKDTSIRSYQHEILHIVKTNPVTIIHGPSGSGKSTQVPQYIFDSYLNLEHAAECCILVAQPRHITALAAAKRIAEERCEELGNSIGYEVTFQSCFPRPYGCILYCTLDVLLKRLEAGIRGVSHIILDEIHERNVKSDFVMTILRDMIKAFPNLRVILMSATMDINPLKHYFPSCAVLEVPLKTHAVQDYYLEDIIQTLGFLPPLNENNEETEYCDHLDDKESIKYQESVNYDFYRNGPRMKGVSFELIIELLKYIKSLEAKGSILVFLPDCNTISALMRHLLNHSAFDNSYLFVPLHSEISPEQMKNVFQPAPSGVTKTILCTNIAETAVTPRDVVYVIDSCKTVIRQFSSNSKSVNYRIALAAKYNLDQRSRQASFVQPGVCFRLYSRSSCAKLKNDIVPEIQYTSLHEIILSIKLLRLGNSKQFLSKILKPPTSKAILDAEELLDELGALDKNGNLTPLGKMLARLPVEPQLGKMIILGCLFSLGDVSCLLAAHHSVHPQSSAPNLEKFIGYRCSDHIAFVNAFTQWKMMQTKDEKEKKEFFDKHNLQIHSLELVYDMKIQLKEIVKSMGFPDACLAEKSLFLTDHDSDVDMVIALLVMGLHPNICFHKESKSASEHQTDYATTFNSPFFVFGRKICTEEAMYKNMTMISVAHLLLFGSRNIQLLDGIIQVDSWINLKMDPKLVSKLVAVRSALEIIINDVVANPNSLDALSITSHQLVAVTKALCTEMCEEVRTGDQSSTISEAEDMEPPKKLRLLDAESWSAKSTWRKKNQLDDDFHNQNTQQSLNNNPFGSNMPYYNKPSDPRLTSANKYRSNNECYEMHLKTQQGEENRTSKAFIDDSDHSQKCTAAYETGRASTFLVGRSDSDCHQRYSAGSGVDKFRTSFQSDEVISRDRTVHESTCKSSPGYWGHDL